MKEVIDKLKENGINEFSTKDLVIYMLHKLDKIETRLIQGDKKFIRISTMLSFHRKIIYGIVITIGGFFLFFLQYLSK